MLKNIVYNNHDAIISTMIIQLKELSVSLVAEIQNLEMERNEITEKILQIDRKNREIDAKVTRLSKAL